MPATTASCGVAPAVLLWTVEFGSKPRRAFWPGGKNGLKWFFLANVARRTYSMVNSEKSPRRMETGHVEKVKSASHEVHGTSVDEWDSWNPPYPPRRPAPPGLDLQSHAKLINEWCAEVNEVIATSRRTQIIIPDRTPEVFYEHGMQVPNDVQLPRNEVIHHVSSILQDNGFGPSGEDVDIGNLSHYEYASSEVSPNKHVKAAPGIPCQHSKAEKVIPAVHVSTLEEPENSRNKLADQGSPLIQDVNLPLVGRNKTSDVIKTSRRLSLDILRFIKLLERWPRKS
ncbi:hypothetical protein EJB05_38074, partial [Eragrostis curvula]